MPVPQPAGVVELVDARDSKSRGDHTPCRFESGLRHQLMKNARQVAEKAFDGHFCVLVNLGKGICRLHHVQ